MREPRASVWTVVLALVVVVAAACSSDKGIAKDGQVGTKDADVGVARRDAETGAGCSTSCGGGGPGCASRCAPACGAGTLCCAWAGGPCQRTEAGPCAGNGGFRCAAPTGGFCPNQCFP